MRLTSVACNEARNSRKRRSGKPAFVGRATRTGQTGHESRVSLEQKPQVCTQTAVCVCTRRALMDSIRSILCPLLDLIPPPAWRWLTVTSESGLNTNRFIPQLKIPPLQSQRYLPAVPTVCRGLPCQAQTLDRKERGDDCLQYIPGGKRTIATISRHERLARELRYCTSSRSSVARWGKDGSLLGFEFGETFASASETVLVLFGVAHKRQETRRDETRRNETRSLHETLVCLLSVGERRAERVLLGNSSLLPIEHDAVVLRSAWGWFR
jgi:hypothetical protein